MPVVYGSVLIGAGYQSPTKQCWAGTAAGSALQTCQDGTGASEGGNHYGNRSDDTDDALTHPCRNSQCRLKHNCAHLPRARLSAGPVITVGVAGGRGQSMSGRLVSRVGWRGVIGRYLTVAPDPTVSPGPQVTGLRCTEVTEGTLERSPPPHSPYILSPKWVRRRRSEPGALFRSSSLVSNTILTLPVRDSRYRNRGARLGFGSDYLITPRTL
ncbi:hypothetical protein Bbelb_192480 [Branchiostoma belcheri]|nr:hypothetical protein Bbelb_192480 [Branchiostoma belcheri]